MTDVLDFGDVTEENDAVSSAKQPRPSSAKQQKQKQSKQRDASHFDPLTVDEFESVSTLVRGRAKLDDVNVVYEAIHKAFTSAKRYTQPFPTRVTVQRCAMLSKRCFLSFFPSFLCNW